MCSWDYNSRLVDIPKDLPLLVALNVPAITKIPKEAFILLHCEEHFYIL